MQQRNHVELLGNTKILFVRQQMRMSLWSFFIRAVSIGRRTTQQMWIRDFLLNEPNTLRSDKLHQFCMFFVSFRCHFCSFSTWFEISAHKPNTEPNHPQICTKMMHASETAVCVGIRVKTTTKTENVRPPVASPFPALRDPCAALAVPFKFKNRKFSLLFCFFSSYFLCVCCPHFMWLCIELSEQSKYFRSFRLHDARTSK